MQNKEKQFLVTNRIHITLYEMY